MRARLGVLAVLAGALLALVLPGSTASAHAFLVASNPADGSVLSTAPKQLRLQFSESVVIAATHLDVVDSAGRHYPATGLTLEQSSDDPEDPVELVAQLPALPRSAYRVAWQTLSSDDLHRTSGVLVFGVAAPVHAAPFVEPLPRAEEAALRWLLFAGLAAALGGLLVARLARRHAALGTARRAARLAVAGGVVAVGASLALLADQLAVSGAPRVLLGAYGSRWALREAGLLTLLGATVWALRRPGRGFAVALAAGAAATGVGTALLGHSGTGAASGVTRVIADAAHLLAAATWAGALGALLVTLLPRGAAAARRPVLRAFAVPAAGCVSVVAASGVYLSAGVVGSVDAALFTWYGRTLLIKLAVVAVAVALALVNHLRVRASGPVPVRTVLAEAVAAVVALGLAAVLTSGQPAREPEFVRAHAPSSVPVQDGAVADLQESLAIRPNRPGHNVAVVDVFDTRRPAPAPIRQVRVALVDAGGRVHAQADAERIEAGRWSAPVRLDAPGPVTVRVTVRRAGLPDTVQDYRWRTGGTSVRTHATVVSTAPIDDLLATCAGWLTLLIALGWLVVLARRPRSRRPRPPAASRGAPEPDRQPLAAGRGATG